MQSPNQTVGHRSGGNSARTAQLCEPLPAEGLPGMGCRGWVDGAVEQVAAGGGLECTCEEARYGAVQGVDEMFRMGG